MGDGPYSRVYWTVMDDDKFDGIRENVRHLGSWTLLLIVADMAWPSPAFPPPTVPKSSLEALSTAGLIDVLSGGRFRVHGLDAEREMRSQSARNAAAMRWHSKGNAEPMLDEAKTRRDETSTTPPPSQAKGRMNGTNPRATGSNPRSKGTSPRQVREGYKTGPTAIRDVLKQVADGTAD